MCYLANYLVIKPEGSIYKCLEYNFVIILDSGFNLLLSRPFDKWRVLMECVQPQRWIKGYDFVSRILQPLSNLNLTCGES